MARLDKAVRERIADELRARLPAHWKVVVGGRGQAVIEVDQDGSRPSHRFPELGSSVIVVQNAPDDHVVADTFVRVKHPPGYCEGRQATGRILEARGRGWRSALINAVVTYAVEQDAGLMSTSVGEA